MAAHTTEAGVAPADLLDAYRTMLRIRLAEETILRLRLAGTVVGSVHLEIGQEAIATGVVGARDGVSDPVFATYRGHGWALACGVTVKALLAEVAGRVGGPNDGRGGAEVAARIARHAFWSLDAPIERVGVPDTRIPAAPILQQALVPGADAIAAAVRRAVNA